jgi:hypothetical protein
MIAENDRAVIAQRIGNSLSGGDALDLDLFIVKQRVIFKENAGLLSDGVEQASLSREWRAPSGVDVHGAYRIGSGFKDGVMYVVASFIDESVSFYQLAFWIDKD